MAETRVEKYREYRKSILTDGNPVMKTAIDTSLEKMSVESDSAPTEAEAKLLKRVKGVKYFYISLFSFVILSIVILLIVFGNVLF